MAYDIVKLDNDRVTKRFKGTEIILYTFGGVARIRVNTRLNTIQFIEGEDPDRESILFTDITNKFGTTDAESYVDYLANNGFFFRLGGSSTELDEYFENQLTTYTLYETISTGTTSGSLATQTGIQIIRDSFGGADLDISEIGQDNYPNSETVLDSLGDIVTANFNPIDTPPDWQLDNLDSGGNDYALIFRVRGTRKDLTTYLQNNTQYFFIDDRGGNESGGVVNFEIPSFKALTNQFLSPIVNRLDSWIDVIWATGFGNNNEFELQTDNINILVKNNSNPEISVKLNSIRINSNNRSTPRIRLLISLDNGLSYIPLTETESNEYIRNNNPQVNKASMSIPSITEESFNFENALIKLQYQITAENNAVQESWSDGYINIKALNNKASIIAQSPVITNPLPSPLNIPSSQLFTHDLGILNATSVQVQNAPPNTEISSSGILKISSPIENLYPNFEIVATNNAPNSTINSVDLSITGFQNFSKWRFNGIDQYAITATQHDLNLRHDDESSIAFWVNINNSSITNPILHKRTFIGKSPNIGYLVQITFNGEIYLKLQNTFTNTLVVKSTPQIDLLDGQRHFVVITKTNSRFASGVELYLDGALLSKVVESDNLLNSSTINNEPLYNGINLSNNSLANMDFDELAIWRNVTLTSTEIANLYNSGLPFNYNSLPNRKPQNWWRSEGANLGVIPNERSTSTFRVLNLVNFDNNIVPF